MLFSTRHSERLLSAASRVFVRFASKKQGGSTSNGRDSNPKFLGLKAGTGQVRVEAIQLSPPPKQSRDSDAEAECCCVTSPGRVASCVAELAFDSATARATLGWSSVSPDRVPLTPCLSFLSCAACAAGQHPCAPARHQVPPGSRGWYGTHPSTLFCVVCAHCALSWERLVAGQGPHLVRPHPRNSPVQAQPGARTQAVVPRPSHCTRQRDRHSHRLRGHRAV